MIKDFRIKNFRHFEDVRLDNLKRVNLFVGKNSAGKSALLEALLLFFTQMSDKHLPEIHAGRQENWEQRNDVVEKSTLRHLFRNHKLPQPGEPGFSLESSNDPRSFEATIRGYQSEADGNLTSFRLIEDELLEVDPDYVEPFLVLQKDYQIHRLMRLSRYGDGRRFRVSRQESTPAAYFVPTRGVTDEEVAALWDAISLTDAEAEVISGLKLIEPSVEGVAFVGYRAQERVALIKLSNHSEPVSLKSLGDGMSRILQIILSLVNAKNSVLLIDEFENGLHWGVQKDVWSLVFNLAERLNVQVFATTHSRDCIEGFESAWEKAPHSGGFARVFKTPSEVSIKEYNLTLLKDSIETDVEVR
ncbi:AAA family ATPase [Pseudomonas viridiflava]|uniref:AAA family ATPase n=1 Tax=Pseudomonas viridiflava TaxID=33069 RepID=UPI002ECA09A1|nr:AAA family ATPase [Pseudomonas viridiflava]